MSDDEKPKWVDLFGIDPDWPVSDHERENHALRRILTDLIAQLRETAATYPGATGRLLMEMAGSAEARLREVQGE